MKAIEVEGISKTFGAQKVIDKLSFGIEENSICGFLGLNGAGKTTTFRLLNGLIAADSGTIKIFGDKVSPSKPSKLIKFLQDVPEFYAYMTATEYLRFICDLNGLEASSSRLDEALELVSLTDARHKRIGKFSRGMKQRIGIAATVIAQPKILLLDEPVSALDPVGRKAVFDLLESLKGKMTILFSTHIIDDVERVSSKIIMIHKGKKVLDGSVADLKGHFVSNTLELDFAKADDLQKFVNSFSSYKLQVEKGKNNLSISAENLPALQQQVFQFLSTEQLTLNELRIVRPSLEEIFVNEVNDEDDASHVNEHIIASEVTVK